MTNLCIISYYGSLETIQLAENALKECINRPVYNFPLFKYMHDKKEKNSAYIDKTIDYIKENNITHLLWWFNGISAKEFIYIKEKTGVKYILFNWDDPFNWKSCEIVEKMKYFDAVFITCNDSVIHYKENGCNEAHCLYPGFSPKINYMITEPVKDIVDKYSCDISFCCTNLYESDENFPNQFINRKKLIDEIYKNQFIQNYKFYIYGPPSLESLYPKSYKGYAKYYDLNNIFNYSKINLCTHVLNNKDGYLNERIFLIGASGGLILVDYVDGIEDVFSVNNEILILDKYYYIDQIVSILKYYKKYNILKNNAYKKCNEKYEYSIWAKTICDVIKKI
jgi:hypothetical protein